MIAILREKWEQMYTVVYSCSLLPPFSRRLATSCWTDDRAPLLITEKVVGGKDALSSVVLKVPSDDQLAWAVKMDYFPTLWSSWFVDCFRRRKNCGCVTSLLDLCESLEPILLDERYHVKRVSLSKPSGSISKHRETEENTRPQAECFYCFEAFGTPDETRSTSFWYDRSRLQIQSNKACKINILVNIVNSSYKSLSVFWKPFVLH